MQWREKLAGLIWGLYRTEICFKLKGDVDRYSDISECVSIVDARAQYQNLNDSEQICVESSTTPCIKGILLKLCKGYIVTFENQISRLATLVV